MSSALLDHLNEQQQAAVIHRNGPAMVLAGAGSGKTTVLTTRVAWLIQEHHIDSTAILLVTFTNKAAGEMKERVAKLTGSVLPMSGTFHSLCAKILRQHGHLVGLPPGFSIYDTDEQLALIKQLYKDQAWSVKDFNPKGVRATISTAKNELVNPVNYESLAQGRYQQHVARVYKLYQHRLQQIGAVDFDDLMLKVIELFQHESTVLHHYQELLQYILIDEYQDTNKAQYQLTKFLAQPQEQVYVVGDFSQSIYAWRGADYRNMLQLKTDFPDIAEYRLERNYRSTQNILDVATNIISHNTTHPILQLWTDKSAMDPITVFEAPDRTAEAQYIIQTIRSLQPQFDLSDMAILYRTNAQSREFEESFVKSGIPYKIIGGVKFYERKEIKDVLSYLKVLVNPNDSVSQERALKNGKRVFQTYMTWKNDILEHYQLDELQPQPILKEILKLTKYLEKYDERDPEELARVENIRELLAVASQFNSVTQFLENIALVQNDEFVDIQGNATTGAVTLMSLHAAKGLEFSVVFMVGMEDGLLPHSRSFMDKEQLEEERRLCYVGVTRAKEKLFLTHARKQVSYNGVTNHLRSRFINDIPEHLIKSEGRREYEPSNPFDSPSRFSSQPQTPVRHLVIDDDTLESVLSGDMDIETFLRS